MGQISQELGDRLRSAIERMPAFPKSVQRILELTRDINCQPKAVVAVIETDPVIAIKILKILNSAHYSLPTKITSVNHSVVYLGLNTVKNLALNFSTVGILPRQNSAGFDIGQYLMHALLTANLTRQLVARYAPEVEADDAYITGLLHNFGKLVFAQFMADEFRRALALAASDGLPLHVAEERVIGADHALVGSMLVQHWQFPPALAECIAGHHQGAGLSPLAQCLHAADRIAERLLAAPPAEGQAVAVDEGQAPIAARFGTDLDGLSAALGDLDKLLADAHTFCQGESLQ